MGLQSLIDLYDKKYKPMMLVTVVILVLALGVIGYNYFSTGEIVRKGVSLKGGITVTLEQSDLTVDIVTSSLAQSFPKADVSVRGAGEPGGAQTIIVEAADLKEEDIIGALRNSGFALPAGSYSTESMGSSLGQSFFRQTASALVAAFILMSIVVYITFRAGAPALFVVLAAASDIVETLAVIILLDIPLSTAGVAAFLMLIGYSVDTDVLLTSWVLKRSEGTVLQRVFRAMRTGMVMTLTALASVLVAYFFTQSDVIKQIMLILAVGLFFDIFNTWIQNAGILRWYLERKVQHE